MILKKLMSGIDTAIPRELADVKVMDICFDSRRASPGALFFALAGRNADGASFAQQAMARGAVAVVTDAAAELGHFPALIRVPDARAALAWAASVFHGLSDIQSGGDFPVVGITGTNGKTTSAYMLRAILAAAGRRAALLGTIECDLVGRRIASQLTTPDPVTLTKYLVEANGCGADSAVMEVSSHSLDQRRADGIRFRIGVFTNLTQDHLDYHETFDAYLAAKRRLFEGLGEDACAVVNADDPASSRILEGCRAGVLRYGIECPADLQAIVRCEDRTGCAFTVEHGDDQVEMQTCMVGRHNVYNCLAATGAAVAMGIDLATAAAGIASLAGVPGRLYRVPTGDAGYEIFVDYAHTDDALRNVLSAVRPLTTGRLWCLFGCGGDRDRTKRPLMARAVARLADCFIITSDNPRTEDPLAIIQDIERGLSPQTPGPLGLTIPDRRSAIFEAVSRLEPGDALVIAGKGHEDYQIIGSEKIHFDDAEEAAQAVAHREGRVHATAHVA